MKISSNIIRFAFGGMIIASLFSSCKKNDDDEKTTTPAAFPAPISNIVSQSMIDSLRNAGTNVYDGTTPPIVNGTFFMTPDSCTFDSSPAHSAGSIYADYKFRFSDQNNTAFTITVDQKNMVNNALSPAPAYSFISGSGNNFTIFILRTISPQGIPVQQYNILSGKLTAGGVQNFQNTLFMRSKGGDFDNAILVPAGTIRVFITGGAGLAGNTTF